MDGKGGYAEIVPIGIHPHFQRKGLARAYIAECCTRLAAESMTSLQRVSPRAFSLQPILRFLGTILKLEEQA